MILLELILASIRFFLVFFGAVAIFFLGGQTYRYINQLLYSNNIPCLEMITFIVALVSPIAFVYGIRHAKGFFQRSKRYNLAIFVLSYGFGMLIAFMPMVGTSVGSIFCSQHTPLASKIAQSFSTGIVTSVLGYISFDLGVIYSAFFLRNLRSDSKKSKAKRVRGK